jgi:putative peptidoglycan lipid II flippase
VKPVSVKLAVRSTARSAITVSAWTMVSRISGLLRVVVIGAVLGPTFFANAFLAANTVPGLVYNAMAGPVLALVLVPALVRSVTEIGVAGSVTLVSKITGYLLMVAAAATAVLALASPLLALAVTAGIPDEAARKQAWELTMLVSLFVAPQILCYALAGIGVAVQQARGRFALAAAAQSLDNVGLIATMGLVALVYRPGLDVQDVPTSMVIVLGIGATVSTAIHAAMQVFGAYRVGLPMRPRCGWRSDPAAIEVTRRLRRSVLVAALPTVSMFAILAIAATVPGGVFVFQAAMSVYFVISALGAKAVTAASLPGLSAAVVGRDVTGFAAAWREGLSLAVTASLPAMLLLLAFTEPVASLLAQGELRDSDVVSWLSGCLVVFAVAQFAAALNETGKQALFARLDDRGPRLISIIIFPVRLAVALPCLLLPAGGYRLAGLACAVLVADVVAATLSLTKVRRAIRPERFLDRRRLVGAATATAAILPAAAVGHWLVREKVHELLPQLAVTVALGTLAALCFGLVLAMMTGTLSKALGEVRARMPGGS